MIGRERIRDFYMVICSLTVDIRFIEPVGNHCETATNRERNVCIVYYCKRCEQGLPECGS